MDKPEREWVFYNPDDKPAPEVTDEPPPEEPLVGAPGPLEPVVPGEVPEGTGKKRRVPLFHADGTLADEDDFEWGEFKKTGDIVLGGTDFPLSAPKLGYGGKPKKKGLEYKPLDSEDQIPDAIPDSELRAVPFTLLATDPPQVLCVEIFHHPPEAAGKPAPEEPEPEPV